MAEFDVDDAGPLVFVTPADNVFARGVVGSQQDMHFGIDPIVIVSLVGDVEILETFRERIGWVGDVHAKIVSRHIPICIKEGASSARVTGLK